MPHGVPHPPPGTIACVGADSKPYLLALSKVVRRIGVKRAIRYRSVTFPGITPRLEYVQTQDGRLHCVLPPGCYVHGRPLPSWVFEEFYETEPDEVAVASDE